MPAFQENIAAAVDAVGLEQLGLVFGIGLMDWDTSQDRDDFLQTLTQDQQV